MKVKVKQQPLMPMVKVGIQALDEKGRVMGRKDGYPGISFTVEDATVEELYKLILRAIEEGSGEQVA